MISTSTIIMNFLSFNFGWGGAVGCKRRRIPHKLNKARGALR